MGRVVAEYERALDDCRRDGAVPLLTIDPPADGAGADMGRAARRRRRT